MDKLNNTLQEKLDRSKKIDFAFLKCGEILRCSPNEMQKRITKMVTQIKQCEKIIETLNG